MKNTTQIMRKKQLIEALAELQRDAHEIAVVHGWWEGKRSKAEAVLKMHTELSELVQAWEQGNPADKHLPQYPSDVVELADLCIRAFDLAGAYEMPLAEAILDKMGFNRGRPYRHGKEF